VSAGRDPLVRPSPPPDGRWQHAEVCDAVYLAESEETAWAEWYRLLAELSIPPHRALPRDLWRFAVDVEVADLSTPSRLLAAGLESPRPGRREWPPYQVVGDRLAAAGWTGLVAPSAARPAGLVLCLFRPGARVLGLRRRPPPRRVDVAPVPPRGLRT
jgi:RES domain-containing protein